MNEKQEQRLIQGVAWLRKLGGTSTVGVLAAFVLVGWYGAEHNFAFGQLRDKVAVIETKQEIAAKERQQAMREIVNALTDIKLMLERRLAPLEATSKASKD